MKKTKFTKSLRLILSVLFILLLSSFTLANVINVPADQSTIQEGINVAVDGDTVLVQPGIYLENINYTGKNITVASMFLTTQDTTYISQTIIDGFNNDSVVTFENWEDSSANITGLTLQNGYAENGGGIYCEYAHPTIKNNIIRENETYNNGYGGGIYLKASNSNIKNNTIFENTSNGGFGGGITIDFHSYSTLINNKITENYSSSWCGGIACMQNSSPTLINNLINDNTCWLSGGGIICYHDASPTLTNNTIVNNTACHWGGGIFCLYNSSPIIKNSILYGNSSWYNDGNQVYLGADNCDPDFYYCDIQGGLAAFGLYTGVNYNGIYENNIEQYPQFLGVGEHPYQLSNNSPCINTGDPNTDISDFPIDIAGNPRIFDIIIDIGAYEFQGGSISAPENITISINTDSVLISWDSVSGATSYKVYSSDNPYTGFEEDDTGSFGETNWSTSIINERTFYYITAIN